MNVTRDGIAVAVGAVVAVLLQVVVAPNIALFGAMPNFVVAYALLVAIVRPMAAGPVMPFVLGLVFDLVSGGPVGAMAFLRVLMTFLAARAFAVLDHDTLFMPLVIFVAAPVLVEAPPSSQPPSRLWRPSPSSSRCSSCAAARRLPTPARRRTCARWATWACPRRGAARASARAAPQRRA